MKHLLISPPFCDPTQPYLSLPTLKGHLREIGLDARVVDLNVEAAHFVFEREFVDDLAYRIGQRFLVLNKRESLDFDEQREYRALVDARPKVERVLLAERSPIETFRDPERFFSAADYAQARRLAEDLFDALSAAHHPYRFHFNRASHEVLPWSFDLLDDYAASERSPLMGLYRRVFEPPQDWNDLEALPLWIDLDEAEFIGISIVFPSQIPEAFLLARWLKQRAPRAFVALGGPCVHQSVVHMEEARRRRVLEQVDGVALFEGEALLASLLPRLREWREADAPARAALLASIPNLLALDAATGAIASGPRASVDLRAAAPPDYSDLDLDRYLGPSRTLLYAPTRGCYWAKCSFCYYGLAETATAAYREVPVEKAAQEIARLAQRHGVRNFYLSCDVLSPRYAVRLAEALLAHDVKIRWSSDLKVDAYFTPERCELLFRSGLRAAAFGIESGSDRILELMRKGCDRETMTRVNRAFAAAGVATQWMTFTDHPDESVAEALSTVRWIAEERESIALFLVGEFGLEQGSHVAQEPKRYGVERIFFADGDDFRLYALFTQRSGERSAADRERVDAAIAAAAAPYASKPYPWAGAISTHHSFLHFLRFGPRAFTTHFQRAHAAMWGAPAEAPLSQLAGLRQKPRFSVDAIEATERRFFAGYLQRALTTTIPGRREGGATEVAPLSLADYRAAAAAVEALRPGRHREG